MDQQRKVIYERRLQVIDGEDLEHTEDLLAGAAEKLVGEYCPRTSKRTGTSRASSTG